jgi:hypothetical protein
MFNVSGWGIFACVPALYSCPFSFPDFTHSAVTAFVLLLIVLVSQTLNFFLVVGCQISMIVTATVTMRDGCGYGLRPRAAVNLTGSHWHHTVTKHASL